MAFEDWSKKEVSLIVPDYFKMLQLELAGQKYSKTDHNKNLLPLLINRNRGAIESKHRNISAVLKEMGLPFINGYKPLSHYQGLLEEEVVSYINENRMPLEREFEDFAKTSPIKLEKNDFTNMEDDEPNPSEVKEFEPTFGPIKINYLEKEQNNRDLGEQGEKLILDYEKWRLRKVGKEGLIHSIKWISKDKGDGAGYDILSKNEDGTDRYIEVKTTKLSKEVPIYLTRIEVSFAKKNAKNFYLYRVFNFAKKPRFFIKKGDYESFCKIQPITYKGIF